MNLQEIREKHSRFQALKLMYDNMHTEIITCEVEGFFRASLYVLLHDLNGNSAGELFHDNVLTVEASSNCLRYDLEKSEERTTLKDFIKQSKIVFINKDTSEFLLDLIDKAEEKYKKQELQELEFSKKRLDDVMRQLDVALGDYKFYSGVGVEKDNQLVIYLVKDIDKRQKELIVNLASRFHYHGYISFRVTGKAYLL